MDQKQKLTREQRILRKKKMRRAKRRRIIRKIRNSCILTLTFLLTGMLLWNFFGNHETKVEKPVVRSDNDVLEYLENMAKKDSDYRKILKHAENYPESLLSALANNPEMLDFVKGYPGDTETASGGLTKKEQKQKFPLFLQWDSRWGYVSYGESNIGLSGCGPVCLSMVAYSLTRNESITPEKVAAYSESQGFYVKETGTAWSLMTEGAASFGIIGTELPLDEGVMKQKLDAGQPIICAMSPGDFTTAGHFIVIYGYDDQGFSVNDPNCIARSEKKWSYEELYTQIKNLWYYTTS